MARPPRKRVVRRPKKQQPASRQLERALPAQPVQRRHNLPTSLTSFVGRETEIAEIKRLLETTRLLTLTGAGGSGKTRLALQVGGDLLGQFSDGVWMVDLAPLPAATSVPRAVATALGVPEQPNRRLDVSLTGALRPKALLLVLDNCEHVVDASAQFAQVILRECPNLRILATSREPLGVVGEFRWTVPSLSLPDHREPPSVDHLTKCEAVRLFVDRAAAAQSTFAMTGSNAHAVGRLCRELDGIPLAIEMAAAWVRVLTVEEILERLARRFEFLRSESRAALPRHQTLKAAMDWSYGLLSTQERVLLSRLSVFSGGWTLEAAVNVCAGNGIASSDILELLTRLVDKSLAVADTRDGHARYRLLETVRQYSLDRLTEGGEATETRRRHRDWYLALAERGESELRGAAQVVWLDRLEEEHANLRAALTWSKADPDSSEEWLRLAAALHGFWHQRGYLSEGRAWLEAALSSASGASRWVRAKALCGAGVLAWRRGDLAAEIPLRESLSLYEELGDKWGQAYALHHVAHVEEKRGDYEQAVALFRRSGELFRDVASKWGIGWSLHCLAGTTFVQGDYARAAALLEESLPLCREVGNVWTTAYVLDNLGRIAERQGNYERAKAFFEEALVLTEQVKDDYHIPTLLQELANVALRQGDTDGAMLLYRQSLLRRRDVGDKLGFPDCLEGFAQVACARGYYERAACLLGIAESLHEALNYKRPPALQVDYDKCVASARDALGESAYAAAQAAGRLMGLEQAMEYALSLPDARPKSQGLARVAARKRAGLLAPRERQVALLIAAGKTNREIAADLSITEGTAEAHVQHILNKLGVNTRAQIAAWVVASALQSPSPTAS